MPFFKKAKTFEPLVKVWDRKAQKCGLHHTVYSVNGDQYKGEWMDNKKHGKGKQIWKKTGKIYDGDWRCGKREGYGLLAKYNKEKKEYVTVYKGDWQNDKKEGDGTYFYSPSVLYEGQWSKDQRAGLGRMQYENGDVYEGEWLRDKQHGQGVLFLANGNCYVGTWRDGLKNGHGKFFYLDRGQLYEGFWVDGVAKRGTISDLERDEAPCPTMYPIPKKPQNSEPLVKVWDRKAQKCGLHHTVYSVNGDQYKDEWMDNKNMVKHTGKGKQIWKKTGKIYDGDWRCGKREGYRLLAKCNQEKKEYVIVYEGG